MANNYQDLAIKRQVLLERIKSGQFRDFNKAFKEIEKLIRLAFAGLDDEFETLPRRKLESFIRDLKEDQIKVFSSYMDDFAIGLSGIAQLTQEQEIEALGKFIDLRGTKLAKFTKIDLQRAILKRPLSVNGDLLASWQKDFTQTESKRVSDVIRLTWSQGETNQQAVRRIIGTKANGFKDGILNTSRRHASTVVRTSVQHVASSARMEIWQKNSKVVRGYEWLSTLDRKTSPQCKSLDGRKFEFEKGPIPPIHPNCRSTTVPVTNPKYDFLDEGATRSAEFGPVSAKDNYYDWLKRQDRQTVIDALGEKRAKLFLDGGLSPARFRDLQFDRNFEPLTLDQMKAKEPNAFKKAFGDSAPVTPRKRDKSQKTTKKVGNQSPPSNVQKREKVASLLSSEEVKKIEDLMDRREEFRAKYIRAKKARKRQEANHFAEQFHKHERSIVDLTRQVNQKARQNLWLEDLEAMGEPESILGEVTKTVEERLSGSVRAATEYLSFVVHKDILPQKVGVKFLKGKKSRAFYSSRDRSININDRTSIGVVIHEFVHDIEYAHPEISKKTKAFLAKRAKGEKPVSLKEKKGGGYKRDEEAFEDEWETKGGSLYTGKHNPDRPSTEVLTMGVQRLYENPVLFANQDPEFFDFIVGTIQQVQ